MIKVTDISQSAYLAFCGYEEKAIETKLIKGKNVVSFIYDITQEEFNKMLVEFCNSDINRFLHFLSDRKTIVHNTDKTCGVGGMDG